MIPPKELLDISTKQIQDKQNKVKLCPYKRLNTKQGYSFITLLKRKAKSIVASVELDVEWERDEDLGFLKKVNCRINTQEKIIGDFCILYQDAIIFLSDFGSYTESMGQYQYGGLAVSVDKLPLIDTEKENEIFGYSCLDLICQIDNFNVIPEFLALDLEATTKGVYLAKIEDSQSLTMITRTSEGLEQIKRDTVNIRGLNVPRKDLMIFIHSLLEFGLNNRLFGLNGDYEVREINNYDNYSNLRGIRYDVSLSLCYNIKTIIESQEKDISIVMFKIKD